MTIAFIKKTTLTLSFMVCGFPILTWASSELVPLEEASWVVLSYNKIPANKVSFENSSLVVKVSKSAGPVVHKLKVPKKISGFVVSGHFKGQKKLEANEFDEDSILRIGLVAVGKQNLSWTKKLFAADWVKKLFALAPEGSGLDKIHFFNLTNRTELVSKSRAHPKSDLIAENISLHFDKQGAFQFVKELPASIEVAAIWISVDGDDTGSEFETALSSIQLKADL